MVDNMPRLQRVNTSCSPRALPAQPYDEAINAGSDDEDEDDNINQMLPPPPPSLRRRLSVEPNDDTPTIPTTTALDNYDEDDIDNYVMISSQNNDMEPDTVYITPGRLNAMRTLSGR